MFETLGSIVAFITGAYTFYKRFLEGPRLELFPADNLGLVAGDSTARKFHLMCNLVNPTAKTATLHRLEAILITPHGKMVPFVWNLFYRYQTGGQVVEKESDPYPLSISERDSKMIPIEFEKQAGVKDPDWLPGRYTFELKGWVNLPSGRARSNLSRVFHIDISQGLSDQIRTKYTSETAIRVPVSEWLEQAEA